MHYRPASVVLAIGGISLFLLVVTLFSYPFVGHGRLSLVLFWLGMGGEINLGAWWSGMLFLVAGCLALELAGLAQGSAAERRGWGAMAAAFALLSFDEVAQLHEFLSDRSELYLAPLGVLGLGLVVYGLASLHRANVPLRALLWAFFLLATVPVQELVQHAREWNNGWIYGARAFVEEGTEVAAALVLIAATGARLVRATPSRLVSFDALVRLEPVLLSVGAAILPLAAVAIHAASFRGPANWLGATAFLLCALVALQRADAWRRATVYLVASVGANAVPAVWNPHLLGVEVNLRALCFGLLLIAGAWLLSTGAPWRNRIGWLFAGVPTLLGAFLLPWPQLVWSMLPPMMALLCFYKEVGAAQTAESVPDKQQRATPDAASAV